MKKMTVTRRGSIISHPGYSDNSTLNDVGLIELPEDAPTESSVVGIIPLPQAAEATNTYENVMATVSGFGDYS